MQIAQNTPPCVTSQCMEMRSETAQRFKPLNTETACGLSPPPRLPLEQAKKELEQASLGTADSSPQPASPSLWKVSFSRRRGGGGGGGDGGRQRRKKEGEERRQWRWWEGGGELLGTTACLPCRLGRTPPPAWRGIYGSEMGADMVGDLQ